MSDYMIKGKRNLKWWVLIIVKVIWIMKCAMFKKIGLEVVRYYEYYLDLFGVFNLKVLFDC